MNKDIVTLKQDSELALVEARKLLKKNSKKSHLYCIRRLDNKTLEMGR